MLPRSYVICTSDLVAELKHRVARHIIGGTWSDCKLLKFIRLDVRQGSEFRLVFDQGSGTQATTPWYLFCNIDASCPYICRVDNVRPLTIAVMLKTFDAAIMIVARRLRD